MGCARRCNPALEFLTFEPAKLALEFGLLAPIGCRSYFRFDLEGAISPASCPGDRCGEAAEMPSPQGGRPEYSPGWTVFYFAKPWEYCSPKQSPRSGRQTGRRFPAFRPLGGLPRRKRNLRFSSHPDILLPGYRGDRGFRAAPRRNLCRFPRKTCRPAGSLRRLNLRPFDDLSIGPRSALVRLWSLAVLRGLRKFQRSYQNV